MVAQVLAFQPRNSRSAGWANGELAEFYRLQDMLHRLGLPVASDVGETDECDPWLVFFRTDTGDVLVHFAREESRFIAVSALNETVLSGRNLREIIDQIMRGQPLVLPAGASANGAILRMHPVTVLLGFVAAALLYSKAHASTTETDAAVSPEPKGAWSISVPSFGNAKPAPSLLAQTPVDFFAPGGAVASSIALLTVPAALKLPWDPAGVIPSAGLNAPVTTTLFEDRQSRQTTELIITDLHGDGKVTPPTMWATPQSHAVDALRPWSADQTLAASAQHDLVAEMAKLGVGNPGLPAPDMSPPSPSGHNLSNTFYINAEAMAPIQPGASLAPLSVHIADLNVEARLLLGTVPSSGAATPFVPVPLTVADLTPEALRLFPAALLSGKIAVSGLTSTLPSAVQDTHGMPSDLASLTSAQALTTTASAIKPGGVADLQHTTAPATSNSGGLDQLLAYANDPTHALNWSVVPPGALVAAAETAGLGLDGVKEVLLFNSTALPLHALQLGDGVVMLDEGLLPLNVEAHLGGPSAGQPVDTSEGIIHLVGMLDLSMLPSSGGASGGLDQILAFANTAGNLLTGARLPESVLDSAAAAAGLSLAGIERVVIYHSADLPVHALDLGAAVAMLDEATLPLPTIAALGELGAGEHLEVSAGQLTLVGVVDLHHGG